MAYVSHQAIFAAEQVRDPRDIEPEAIAIDLDQRRPSPCPSRQPLDQSHIAFRIGRNRHQAWIERPSVGQPRSRPRSALRRSRGHGMDEKPVRAFDRQNDRCVRRVVD
jgi:hypothetical protein